MPVYHRGLTRDEVLNWRNPWVFGFGSLMWDPGFLFLEKQAAQLYGWHRQFSLKSTKAWGTEEKPGLVVALSNGGSCLGAAFRIDPQHWEETLHYLEQREAAYRFVTGRIKLRDRSVEALTFAIDPKHPRTLPDLSVRETAHLIRQGRGEKGSSYDYFKGIETQLMALFSARPPALARISAALNKIS